jgi:hypothetical protein
MWVEFDFGENHRFSQVEVKCANKNARPVTIEISTRDSAGGWEVVVQEPFPLKTDDNKGKGWFTLGPEFNHVKEIRIDFKEIVNSYYIGVNNI